MRGFRSTGNLASALAASTLEDDSVSPAVVYDPLAQTRSPMMSLVTGLLDLIDGKSTTIDWTVAAVKALSDLYSGEHKLARLLVPGVVETTGTSSWSPGFLERFPDSRIRRNKSQLELRRRGVEAGTTTVSCSLLPLPPVRLRCLAERREF